MVVQRGHLLLKASRELTQFITTYKIQNNIHNLQQFTQFTTLHIELIATAFTTV